MEHFTSPLSPLDEVNLSLCLIKHHPMRTNGEVYVYCHAYLTTPLQLNWLYGIEFWFEKVVKMIEAYSLRYCLNIFQLETDE
jgi:hypothetical protein